MVLERYKKDAVELLKSLIASPSFSREEERVSAFLAEIITAWGLPLERIKNNLICRDPNWRDGLPVILLNSHIDTVKPVQGWTRDPFTALQDGETIYGLGSNDAGASLVSLLAAFRHFSAQADKPFNLIYLASAEEEISGVNGVESVVSELGVVDLAIVGEPTQMQMAIAEKGLMVLDCEAPGKAGHAAREEGENAIYNALNDIAILKELRFPRRSEVLGEVKLSVTQIEAGHQHNVVPDSCRFVVDVRTNEHYPNELAFKYIDSKVTSICQPRSFRLNSSYIPVEHPLVQRGILLGLSYFGSPTTSDQAVMPYTSIKIGPGDSARSHTADEYIHVSEIEEGIEIYCQLLDDLVLFDAKI